MGNKYPTGIWVTVKARVHQDRSPVPAETRLWLRSHNEDYAVLVTDDWIVGPTDPPFGWPRCGSLLEALAKVESEDAAVLLRCQQPSHHIGQHANGRTTWTTDQESGEIGS